jgi:DUF438 domain-containing protein
VSEYIDRAKRQEILKGLIQELHAGKSIDDVKEAFAQLIQDIAPAEIAEMEQSLIAEGIPETEVKRLCDVHVAVFRESLDAQAEGRPETISGHPVHTFRAENEAVEQVLAALQTALDALRATPGAAQLKEARQELAHLREYEKHYLRKENILFPFLERHNFSGPSTVMWAIHDDIRAGWKALDGLLAAGPGDDPAAFKAQMSEVFPPLKTAISEMVYKEENILFPTALEKLSQEEWVEIRTQEPGVGYCYVQPGKRWLSVVSVDSEAGDLLTVGPTDDRPGTEPAPAGELHLDTGVLTPEQVNLLLTHLPVEITYVDKDDRVRYYSQTRELIFPRSPAVIGRKVQLCHPPDSIHKVQRILNDFRAGRRDVAEFWIHMKGMFIHIRYFALRDAAGEYQGTMEVTQEISRIRELEGERRLLDEGE